MILMILHTKLLSRFTLACITFLSLALIAPHERLATSVSMLAQGVLLPPNFKLELYASGLKTPRFVSFSPEGDLYVAEFGLTDNVIKVLPDRNHDGVPDRVVVFAEGLYSPNNVVFHAGAVYVGEFGRVVRFTDTNGDLQADTREVFIDNLPDDGQHKTKTIAWG